MKAKILLVSLISLGVIGYLIYHQVNKKVESIASQKADFEITANELMLAFESDETKANENYLDKIILVSGVVSGIESNQDRTSIFLDTENDFGKVICQLEKKPDNLPSEGDQLDIKGVCTGYLMDVVIIRSIIQ